MDSITVLKSLDPASAIEDFRARMNRVEMALIRNSDGEIQVVNLSQIRTIEPMKAGVRIVFAPDHVLLLTGEAGKQLRAAIGGE